MKSAESKNSIIADKIEAVKKSEENRLKILNNRLEMSATDPLITYREAAALVGCHEKTIIRWVRSGKLPVVKISSKTHRVKMSELEKML